MIKYTFWAHSVKGLEKEVVLYANNHEEAKRKVMKYIYLGKVAQHLTK